MRIFSTVILAGSRPGGDPLAQAHGVPHKALVDVAGETMLFRALTTLRAARQVGSIAICGMEEAQARLEPLAAQMIDSGELEVLPGRATPAASVAAAVQAKSDSLPILITTADHPLLTADMVDEFCSKAETAEGDMAVAVVSEDKVRDKFPRVERTFTRLSDGAFTGCNLFSFHTADSWRAADYWVQVEAVRKKPWRMIRILGVGVLIRFLLGRLSLADIVAEVSARMQLDLRVVYMDAAEAGLDVDKASHVELVRELLST